jgi:gas vesicle protein GvpA/GvpJ/GvpM family
VSFEPRRAAQGQSTTLVDILDRILDKGLVVAGDVRISLANVELLTIRIRLLVCSIDKAEQIGLNWWRYDRALVAQEEAETTILRLESRIAELEQRLARAERPSPPPRKR